MRDKICNLIKYPLVVFFSLFIFLFFFGYLFCPQNEKSEWENRFLKTRPEIKLSSLADGSYMKDFESYTNDQIIFRDQLIKLKAVCEEVFLRNVNNGIVKAHNGQLFTEDLTDGTIFKKNTAIISDFIKNNDRNFTIAIAPNACGIYKDSVPKGMPVPDQTEKIKDFEGEISLLDNVRVVDLIEVLNNHRDEYIYYRTDHHWTTLGAYLAYGKISKNPVSIDTQNSNKIEDFYGTLYAKYKGVGVAPDVISYYDIPIKEAVFGEITTDTLYDLSKKDVFDKYGLFLYGNYGYSEIHSGKAQDESNNKLNQLIVFKDSYANSVIPFLTYDYDTIKIIDLRYYGSSVKEFLNENEGDVLLLYNYDFVNEDNHFYKLLK